MKPEKDRMWAVRHAAIKKWNDRRIAVGHNGDGVWFIKSLTGLWSLDTSVSPPFAREQSVVYWIGPTLEDAEKEVGLR